MFNRSMKFISWVSVFVFLFFVSNVFVFAETATVDLGHKIYYYTGKDANYGKYSHTTTSKYTIIKTLDGEEAYCAQADSRSPKAGEVYERVDWGDSVEGLIWDSIHAYTAGFLLADIEKNYSSDEEYVYKYAAINSYLGLNSSINFASYNSLFSSAIARAKASYNDIGQDLPDFSAKASKTLMEERKSTTEGTYYVGSFTLDKLIKQYGGDTTDFGGDGGIVTYTIKLPSGATLYKDAELKNKAGTEYSNYSGSLTFYVKYTGNKVGEDITITITAKNSNKFPIVHLWKPTTSNSQLLVTSDVRTKNREKKKKVVFEVPDVSKKTIKVIKRDAFSGDVLKGANLTLQLSGASTKSCTISGTSAYSCSITIEEELLGDTYYSVIENSSPSGYIRGTSIPETKWEIGTNDTACYVSSGDTLTKVDDVSECDHNYTLGSICTLDDQSVKLGNCEVVPSEIEGEPAKVIGTESTACYFGSNDSFQVVDNSKCSNQYTKITNSSGNLVVEYYNNKNHIEISKFAINGDQELVGAELKICSDKPDSNGKCTVVRNKMEGQCSDDANFTSEFNCKNVDDETKTVDMHWISSSTPRTWYGIPKGTYYLVETVAPFGYLPISTYVEFSVDEDGNITSEGYDDNLKRLIVRNRPTSFKVIKNDAVTGKSLAGASLSICPAVKDDAGNYQLQVGNDGYCIPAVLADGTSAVWTSDGKPKVINGLVVGAYYLIENSAPENYKVSDAILFVVNEDGTLSDKDGKSIANNELIMKDDPIVNEKTGELAVWKVIMIGVIAISVCGASYYCLVTKKGLEALKGILGKK